MQGNEQVFNALETLSTALLMAEIVTEEEQRVWKTFYCNTRFKSLLDSEHHNKSDEELCLFLDEVLLPLAEACLQIDAGKKKTATLKAFPLFDKIFDLSISINDDQTLSVLFSESEKMLCYSDISKSCSAITVVLDANGNIVDANNAFLKITHYKKAEIENRPFFEMFIPGDIEKLQHYFEDILNNDDFHHHFITPFHDKNRKRYRLHWQVSKIVKNEDVYIYCIGSDITAMLDGQDQVRHELKRLKLGFDYFPTGIAYVNASGEVMESNHRFGFLLSVKTTNKAVMYDDIGALKKVANFRSLTKRMKEHQETEYEFARKINGIKVWLRLEIRKLKGKTPESLFYILSLSDISILKHHAYQHQVLFRAYEQLRQLNYIFSKSLKDENLISKVLNTLMLNGIYEGMLFYLYDREKNLLKPLSSSDKKKMPVDTLPELDLDGEISGLAESFVQKETRSYIEEEVRSTASLKPFLPWISPKGGTLHTFAVLNNDEALGLLTVAVDAKRSKLFTTHFLDELEYICKVLGHELVMLS